MRKPTTNLQNLLVNNRLLSLANIYRQYHYHELLEKQVRSVIDPLVDFAYVLGQYKNNTLVVYVANHSQGQFLRLQHYSIVNSLKQMDFADLSKLKVLVDPEFFNAKDLEDNKPAKSAIKEDNLELVKQSACQVTNPNLAKALDKFASTLDELHES